MCPGKRGDYSFRWKFHPKCFWKRKRTALSFGRVSILAPSPPAVLQTSVRLDGPDAQAGGAKEMSSWETPSRPHFHICGASSWSSGVWCRSEPDELQRTKRKSCRRAGFNEGESWAHYWGPQCAPVAMVTSEHGSKKEVMGKRQCSKQTEGRAMLRQTPWGI